jgi:hypothetical protein
MRTRLLVASVAVMAGVAMNSTYCGLTEACGWLGLNATVLISRALWTNGSAILGAMHACDCLAAMLLMTTIVAVSRR